MDLSNPYKPTTFGFNILNNSDFDMVDNEWFEQPKKFENEEMKANRTNLTILSWKIGSDCN